MSGSALFLVHDGDVGRARRLPGTLGEHAAAAGLRVDVRPVWGDLPEPDEPELVVVMGSAASAYDDDHVAWLGTEIAYLKRVVAARTPILGVCFGGQVLSRVLGGRVSRAPQPEIGFVDVTSADQDVVASGPWMEFHYDRFTVPPGATQVATSSAAVQAYTHGPHLGLQFHPEISPDVMDVWVASWGSGRGDAGAANEARRLAGTGVQLDQVKADIARREEESRARAGELFSAFRRRAVPSVAG